MKYLVLLWIISTIFLVLFPYSIAIFYQRSFKRNTYAYLFITALALFIAFSISYTYPPFYTGYVFFAVGGVLLGGASLRLHHVMTKRWK